MALTVIAGASVSTAAQHSHVHVRYGAPNVGSSVSLGLANEKTFFVPVLTRNLGVFVTGTFGSGSASGAMCIDVSPNAGSTFLNLASISAPQMTTIPIFADTIVRFRPAWSSAIAAAGIGMSVDVQIAY